MVIEHARRIARAHGTLTIVQTSCPDAVTTQLIEGKIMVFVSIDFMEKLLQSGAQRSSTVHSAAPLPLTTALSRDRRRRRLAR
jgi:hypothetical protein